MRFPSTPMSVRDRSSDVSGSTAGGSPTAKGDKSARVGGRRSAGYMAKKSSMAKGPRGKRVTMPGGQKSYHNR